MSGKAKQLGVAAFLITLVFIPSLFADLCSVDDQDVYKWIATTEFSLKDLFFPQNAGGAYYRPLIGVSYLFDKYVWLLDTRLMHLDNLLFHLANAFLVYSLACQLLPLSSSQRRTIPLVASLIFGMHPLTTESVAWISGRTDVMSGTFVLLSARFLLKYRETGKVCNLVLALAVLIPGLLIKETAFAFVLGGLFIVFALRDESLEQTPSASAGDSEAIVRCALFALIAAVLLIVTYSVWPVLFIAFAYLGYEIFRDYRAGKSFQVIIGLGVIVGVALPTGLFFFIRKVVFLSSISSIGNTLKLIIGDINYACQTFFGAVGFYVRKFIFPFPLNLAIREIDPMYNPIGVLVFFICLYAIRRRTINTAFFLSGICLLLPAVPLSLGTITWTAYAERYVYMSTAFWVLSMSLWFGRKIFVERYERVATVCVTLLLIVMGICTLQRNIIWKSNLALLHDTVTKSPGFKLLRQDYMIALMSSGDLEGAKEQYKIAQSIRGVGYMELLDINMAVIYALEGKNADAEKMFDTVLKKTFGKSLVAYQAYISFLQDEYAAATMRKDGSAFGAGVKLVENMEKLYRLNKDPVLMYRAGQISLVQGRCDEALRLFNTAAKAFPVESDYARFSLRLVKQLGSGTCRSQESL